MSEFQQYQFQSIDRPLTAEERKEISSWSSRCNPTATAATFSYSYGDFPKDAEKVVEKYFDAMLYVANWGSKRLLFRLPKNLIVEEELSAYSFEDDISEDSIRLLECKHCYLLDIRFENEESEHIEWLSRLANGEPGLVMAFRKYLRELAAFGGK